MTVAIVELVQAAVAFTWLGLVLAISFVETPLKFPAPGSPCRSVPVSGRLVFRALNVVELVFTAALTAAILAGAPVWALILRWQR